MKSPIERKLRDALRSNPSTHTVVFDYTNHPGAYDVHVYKKYGTARPVPNFEDQPESIEIGSGENHASLFADAKVLTYRIDLLLFIECWATPQWLAVECDGHDWHDRTKQQAAYDRSRDRELLSIGIHTIRFTGSEIHHSASRCAAEVWQLVAAIRERSNLQRLAYEAGVSDGQQKLQTALASVGTFAGALGEMG